MNEIIESLMNRRSWRQYSDKPVGRETIRAIAAAAQAAPSWVHGQHVTMIEVRDEDRKERLAVLSGNQRHVAKAPVFLVFCMDFHRIQLALAAENKPFEAAKDVDLLLVGATDTGLAMANAITAAESMGLRTIPIGGVRRSSGAVAGLLELPPLVFPVAGLCIGYPEGDAAAKPRLPLELVLHEETYDADSAQRLLREYDEQFREAMAAQGQSERGWSETVAFFYGNNPVYGDTEETLKRQGFLGGGADSDQEG